MNISIKVLKAGNGDSILINFLNNDGKFRNMLVDGGNSSYDYKTVLKEEILNICEREESIDLLIISHSDQDHIKGIEYLLKDSEIDKSIIKEVWLNSILPDDQNALLNMDISFLDLHKVQRLITENAINQNYNISIDKWPVYKVGDALITILSPKKLDIDIFRVLYDKKKKEFDIAGTANDYNESIEKLISKSVGLIEDLDTKLENRTSIAFLFEISNTSILFLGDANPDVLIDSINHILLQRREKKLSVDFVKLSHHGSVRSISLDLLDLINCNNYIISTNGKRANLPNKSAIAKILSRKSKTKKDIFMFNHENFSQKLNFTPEEFEQYNFKCLDANSNIGYHIVL